MRASSESFDYKEAAKGGVYKALSQALLHLAWRCAEMPGSGKAEFLASLLRGEEHVIKICLSRNGWDYKLVAELVEEEEICEHS